jgi:hypothetical protein
MNFAIGVDRNLVKEWAFHFKESLTEEANPSKGIPRQFSPSDLQVLIYVSMNWEDEPDFEEMRVGLSCGNQQGEPYNNIFNNILTSVTPLFQQLPEDLDETWRHGSLVGGMATYAFDTFTLADSYKLAGDVLVDAVLSTAEAYELVYPIIYNYRHATELYLKAILPPKNKDHDLASRLQRLRDYLKHEHDIVIPTWFENVVLGFHDFDPDSTTFRYGDKGVISHSTGDAGEFWVDLHHTKKLMKRVADSFQRIKSMLAARH